MRRFKGVRAPGLLTPFLACQRFKKADKLIKPGQRRGRILDIGCGSYPVFLSGTEFAEKYGLDRIEQESKIKGNIKLINFDLANETRMPFIDGFFDVVTMLAVIEHVRRNMSVRVMREIHRVLKPAGVCIMTTPAPWTDRLLKVLSKLRITSPSEYEEHQDVYNHKKLLHSLARAGFKEENIKMGYFELFLNIWCAAVK